MLTISRQRQGIGWQRDGLALARDGLSCGPIARPVFAPRRQ